MNLKIIKEDLDPESSRALGGEYALTTLEVIVDKNASIREQRRLVIHAIIENFARPWVHEKVDELCELIQEGLDELVIVNYGD